MVQRLSASLVRTEAGSTVQDCIDYTDLTKTADFSGGTYLPTLSNMRNGGDFHLANALTKSKYSDIKNRVNTDDQSSLINNVLSDARSVVLSEGLWYTDSPISLPQATALVGINPMREYRETAPSVLKARHNGIGVVSSQYGAALKHLTIVGNANLDCAVEVTFGNIDCTGVGVNMTKNQGIRVLAGSVASVLQDLILVNTMQDRAAFSEIKASLDVLGTDHFLYRVEANGKSGFTTVTPGRFAAAIRVGGSNHFITDCIGEFGEVGVYVDGGRCRFVNTRADRCMGDGWDVRGSSNSFSNPMAIGIGSAAANTYDGFIAGGSSNVFIGAQVVSQDGTIPRYGIRDTVSSNTQWNTWENPACPATVGTRKFINADFLGSPFSFPNKAKTSSSGGSVAVDGISYVYFNPTAAISVTDLSGGVNTQVVSLHAGNANTTLTTGTNFVVKGGTRTMAQNEIATFFNFNGRWYEK